jgi:rhodanese-related sulfurtransferase
MKQITPLELRAWQDDGAREAPVLVDVREAWELEVCALPGARHVPLGQIPHALEDLDPERDTVLICHHGARSMQAAWFLEQNGFSRVWNLAGGLDAWARSADREMATY